jgi:hypothetical protein
VPDQAAIEGDLTVTHRASPELIASAASGQQMSGTAFVEPLSSGRPLIQGPSALLCESSSGAPGK